MSRPFVAQQDREDRAYVLAKYLSFAIEIKEHLHTLPVAWPPHFYEAVSNATGIKFTLGAWDHDYKSDLPPGLTNHGVLPQQEFVDTLSRSRVLVGVGNPEACVKSLTMLTMFFSMGFFSLADNRHPMMRCV